MRWMYPHILKKKISLLVVNGSFENTIKNVTNNFKIFFNVWFHIKSLKNIQE